MGDNRLIKLVNFIMSSLPPSHRIALEQRIQPLLQAQRQEPVVLHHDNTAYVVKFARREAGRLWREHLSSFILWLLFQQRVSPYQLRAGSIAHEAQRLRQLRAAGITVPALYLETPDYIVMEHCGESVEYRLRRTPYDRDLLQAIVQSLIQLHKQQQWHGGAQVRNLTIKNQLLYRIDFEENTGNAMPLALAQAYDVLLCFNSLATHIQQNQTLGVELLQRYLQQTQQPEVRHLLIKVDRYLQRLQRLLPLLGKKLQHSKDIRQTRYFAAILHQSLQADASS